MNLPVFNLNQGQDTAGEAFFQFLFSKDKEFIISGFAGVGKTYLMGYMIDNIMPRYFEMCKLMGIKPEYDSVVMTATTNKAAVVLQEATKRPTQTIHSFMNVRVNNDFSTGKTSLVKTKNWDVHDRIILFIDECSMVDSELHTIINEGTHNCKIIYVGDHHQLAPVFETISPIYKRGAPFYELTQQMRNAEQPALMEACQQLRMTVSDGIFKPLTTTPGVIDLLPAQQMEDEINSQFMYQTLDKRILTFTNERAIAYNDHIRAIRKLPDSFTPGELVINSGNIVINKRAISVETGIEIISNKGADRREIEPNVWLDVDIINFKTDYGEIFTDVPVPTNKSHFKELVKYYTRNKKWKLKFQLTDNYPDLRGREAATVHKAQGSTYDTVFIDLDNINMCHQPDLVARMMYVAVSRAKNRVYMYGKLADKYGGVIDG